MTLQAFIFQFRCYRQWCLYPEIIKRYLLCNTKTQLVYDSWNEYGIPVLQIEIQLFLNL